MTLQDMADLLRVHDAVEDLRKIASKLGGVWEYGFSFDDSIIVRLDHVSEVYL